MDILQNDFLKKQHIFASIQEENYYLEELYHEKKEELQNIEIMLKEVNIACSNNNKI